MLFNFLYIYFLIGILMSYSFILFFIFYTLIFLQLIFFQIKTLNILNLNECLKIFKSNNFLGFLVFINILIGKIFLMKNY